MDGTAVRFYITLNFICDVFACGEHKLGDLIIDEAHTIGGLKAAA